MPGRLAGCGSRTLVAKNCRVCGEFRDAKHFGRKKRGDWYSDCRACRNVSASLNNKKRNAQSKDTAKKHFDVWTENDIKQLKAMTTAGLGAYEIAEILGRTRQAVYTARKKFL